MQFINCYDFFFNSLSALKLDLGSSLKKKEVRSNFGLSSTCCKYFIETPDPEVKSLCTCSVVNGEKLALPEEKISWWDLNFYGIGPGLSIYGNWILEIL